MEHPNLPDKSTTIKPPKLLDQVRGKLRVKHYSIRTEQAYVDWINALFSSTASVIRDSNSKPFFPPNVGEPPHAALMLDYRYTVIFCKRRNRIKYRLGFR